MNNIKGILYSLHDEIAGMRENGETDLRTVLHFIDNAIQEAAKNEKKVIEAAPKSFSLYELTSNYLQVQDLSEDMDQETLQNTLEAIEEQFEMKAENIVKLMKMNEGEAAALDTEIKRLQERKKKIDTKNTQLKDYLHHHMTQANIKKVNSTLFTISVKKNPPKVKVLDEAAIPPFYFRQIVKHEVDKKELLKDLKEGQEIEGVTLAQDTTLTIK